MDPHVRYYADPLEGLQSQLTELRGLSKIVPPLVEQDREQRWEEISRRPSDGDDDDVVDVFGAEAGAEEGYGFADFAHAIRASAIVFAWAVFEDYIVRDLKSRLVGGDAERWDRLDDIRKRYRDAGISLAEIEGWDHVRHAQALRNALVHNQKQYTRKYLDTQHAYRPTTDELPFRAPGDDDLIDREVIPLSLDLVDGVIAELGKFAVGVRAAIVT